MARKEELLKRIGERLTSWTRRLESVDAQNTKLVSANHEAGEADPHASDEAPDVIASEDFAGQSDRVEPST